MMADKRTLALVKPIEGQSHWCEGLSDTCAQVVKNDSDHCEARHSNAIRSEVITESKVSGLAPEASAFGVDDLACPNCGYPLGSIPSEPPIGTWVRGRDGAASIRTSDGWAAALSGCRVDDGAWEEIWRDRGPLIECGPYGAEITSELEMSGLAPEASALTSPAISECYCSPALGLNADCPEHGMDAMAKWSEAEDERLAHSTPDTTGTSPETNAVGDGPNEVVV